VLSEAFRGARLKKLILSRNRALVAASAPVLSLSLVHLELAFNVLETRLSWLSRLSGLVFLDLRYNSMGAEGAEVLAHALAGHNNLVHLDLSYNSIGMALHGRARMSRFMGLKRMDRMYGVLNRTLVGIKAITGMMLPTLETLILAGNDIDNDGARLVSLVRTETIDLRNNRIDAQGAKRLAKALGNRSVSLDLSGNDLVREDVEKFFAPRIRLRV
jgi:Ran GTPase-activating protein (RanGAP) involved in mRNA processing and transport